MQLSAKKAQYSIYDNGLLCDRTFSMADTRESQHVSDKRSVRMAVIQEVGIQLIVFFIHSNDRRQ